MAAKTDDSDKAPVFRTIDEGLSPTPLFVKDDPPAETKKTDRKAKLRFWRSQATNLWDDSVLDARDAFTDEPARYETNSDIDSRLTLKILIIGIALVFVVALIAWYMPHSQGKTPDKSLDLSAEKHLQVLPGAEPVALPIKDVTSVSGIPDGYDNANLAGLATDGRENTAWRTASLRSAILTGGRGYGLSLNLGDAPVQVRRVSITTAAQGGQLELRSTTADNPAGGKLLAKSSLRSPTIFDLPKPIQTKNLVLWCTELPKAPGGANRLMISEVTVLG